MAVAAGVVIMAITNSANDRLRGQQTDQDSACEPWEVHDIGLESAGRGGPSAQGGLDSSAIGCRRVCYVNLKDSMTKIKLTGSAATPPAIKWSDGKSDVTLKESIFAFSRADKFNLTFPAASTDEEKTITTSTDSWAPVNGLRTVDLNGNAPSSSTLNTTATIAEIDLSKSGGSADAEFKDNTNLSFRVHASGDYCIVEDSTKTTANQRQVLRSKP